MSAITITNCRPALKALPYIKTTIKTGDYDKIIEPLTEFMSKLGGTVTTISWKAIRRFAFGFFSILVAIFETLSFTLI